MNGGLRMVVLAFCSLGWAHGQDGKVQYETYCGACHGVDGKGGGEGQFPPLARSNWVKGTHARTVQVVLHGLQGEVTVSTGKGKPKTYNLAMPPQGEALTDEQIAAITTYVRASWGNKESAVTKEMVAKERVASKSQKEMWTAETILKRYPLPTEGLGTIENLIAKVYQGKLSSLADLRKAELVSAEEEKGGIISLRHAGKLKSGFGLVWLGDVVAPVDGEYVFELDSDDGSAVWVNDKLVVELNSIGPMGRQKTGKVRLKKGRHALKVEYFDRSGNQGISLRWRGPKLAPVLLSESKGGKKRPSAPSIPIVPPPGEAVIYRNFIAGTTARAIAVGYDRGINLAFSADDVAMELLWTGAFMDGGLHWSGRGKGNATPPGEVLKLSTGPAFALLDDAKAPWPAAPQEELKPRFRGYRLNERNQPTFLYSLGDLQVTDFPEAKGGESVPGLARRLVIEAGSDAPKVVYFLLAQNLPTKAAGSGGFQIGPRLFAQVSGPAAGPPVVRERELLIPIKLKPGRNQVLINYTLE